MRPSKISAISAELDYWMRRATDASITAAKDVIGDMGPIRSGTPVGMLTRSEWGWILFERHLGLDRDAIRAGDDRRLERRTRDSNDGAYARAVGRGHGPHGPGQAVRSLP